MILTFENFERNQLKLILKKHSYSPEDKLEKVTATPPKVKIKDRC